MEKYISPDEKLKELFENSLFFLLDIDISSDEELKELILKDINNVYDKINKYIEK